MYPWKNISFLLVAPQKVLRVRTTEGLLFHQSKHVTAQGHFETFYMNAISSGAMCRTIDVNAPEKIRDCSLSMKKARTTSDQLYTNTCFCLHEGGMKCETSIKLLSSQVGLTDDHC